MPPPAFAASPSGEGDALGSGQRVQPVRGRGRGPDGRTAAGTAIVRLVQFPPIWGRNVSPFALKLETWLRLAGVPFEVRASLNLAKAPKGKLPFIVDAGREIGDSTLAIEHLKRTRGIDPDAGLSDRQRAEAVALQRMFEDHFYWIMVYSRWVDPAGWRASAMGMFRPLPWIVRPFARRTARKRVRQMLHTQGTGRHTHAEIHDFATQDLDAAAAVLGDRPFFAGDQLTTVDAVAFGFLANVLHVPIETDLKRLAKGYPNLVAWCETMEAGLYGEADVAANHAPSPARGRGLG